MGNTTAGTLTGADKINQIIKTMKVLSRLYPSGSNNRYQKMIEEYYSRVRNARQNGELVVAHTMYVPTEIIYAMGVAPLHVEITCWLMSLFCGDCSDVLSRAAEMGLVPEICSAHRMVGAAVEMGILPPTDAVVCTNLVCDNALKTGELTMAINRCPGFLFDYPFHQNAAGRQFVIRELKDMVAFLEQVTGRKMDRDKLSENVANSDKQIDLVRQINNLCRKVPLPYHPVDFMKYLVIDNMFAGRPEAVRYLETFRDEVQALADSGKGFAQPEKIRLMGLLPPPIYLMGQIYEFMRTHNATMVSFPTMYDWEEFHLDPAKPIESIALKWENIPTMRAYGPLDERLLGAIRKGVRDYRVDGVVIFAHVGCRNMGPIYKIVKDVLDEMDIPMTIIDSDICDPTIASIDEIQNKLDLFFELIEERR
jgi:benzoyl-CoA reductase/2-hydroxyglutaryl-CoA dehydratase subunit BcrC/BadD/HgdB